MAVRGAPKRAGQALLSTFLSLFSTFEHGRMAVRGAPKRAGHALHSTLFSLFSTFTKKTPSRIVVRNGALR